MENRPAPVPPLPFRPYAVVCVTHLERAIEFYSNVFEFTVTYHDRTAKYVELVPNGDHSVPIALWEVPQAQFTPSRMFSTFLAMRADSVARRYEDLKLKGIDVSPLFEMYGVPYFMVNDPDGNVSYVFEFTPDW